MPRYIRAFVPAGTFFFTVTLLDRRKALLTDHIELLRDAFASVRASHPFTIDAMVVLPEHLHCIWTLPESDADFSRRWQKIKARFSRNIPVGEALSARRMAKGERGIWQRRFWEHVIRDDRDLERHLDYIHFNPVKHGHVGQAADWPYSSFQRYVERGVYKPDWGAGNDVQALDFE